MLYPSKKLINPSTMKLETVSPGWTLAVRNIPIFYSSLSFPNGVFGLVIVSM